MLWVTKETRKQSSFYIPGNSKNFRMVRTLKMFQWFCVSEDGQNV
jgi:hypothetical protein